MDVKDISDEELRDILKTFPNDILITDDLVIEVYNNGIQSSGTVEDT